MKLIVGIAAFAIWLFASPALALDWQAVPDEAWAGDAAVGIEGVYTNGTGGTVIGPIVPLIGPLQPGVQRPVLGGQFTGTGKNVCARIQAVRYGVGNPQPVLDRSPEVENCFTFRLAAPGLLAPR